MPDCTGVVICSFSEHLPLHDAPEAAAGQLHETVRSLTVNATGTGHRRV